MVRSVVAQIVPARLPSPALIGRFGLYLYLSVTKQWWLVVLANDCISCYWLAVRRKSCHDLVFKCFPLSKSHEEYEGILVSSKFFGVCSLAMSFKMWFSFEFLLIHEGPKEQPLMGIKYILPLTCTLNRHTEALSQCTHHTEHFK